ncbi:MAG: GGDEF domain-containing protein [Ruminiclostridium sp.]|nr:GGDEF domain-containing protein [Ruminiclostridium sp.]
MKRSIAMIGKYRIIALLTSRIQERECHGLIHTLEEIFARIDYRLFVYNCITQSDTKLKENDPQTLIYSLFDSDFADAVILDSGRVGNKTVCENVVRRAREMNLPVISLGECCEGCLNIEYVHSRGIEALVDHLIIVHGIDDFHMIAGPKGNRFSDSRIEAFKSALEKNEMPFDEGMVSYGDFWADPAVAAAENLLESNRLPRAFVCANDQMAIAVSVFLQSRGISVPEEVIVVGYDCIDTIYSSSPTMTSACISSETISRIIMDSLLSIFSGGSAEGHKMAIPEPVFNESCGCCSKKSDAAVLFNEQTNMFCRFQDENIILSEVAAKIQQSASFEDIAPVIHAGSLIYDMCCLIKREYIDESVNPEESFGLRSENGLYLLYDSDMINYNRTKGESFAPYTMPSREIIPTMDFYLDNGRSLIFTALHYLDVSFGYVCFHFREYHVGSFYKIPQTVNMLNNALGGLINLRYKHYLLKRIEKMSGTDVLTGLYNRRGFCAEYERLTESNANGGLSLAVIMCDLDGLKYINDNFGHEEGDNAIHVAACALKSACPPEAVCTRFGGDEMMAVYTCGEDCGSVRDRFAEYLDKYNSESGKPYTVAASMGIYIAPKGEFHDFEELVKKSDTLMYAEKKRRKAER